jgi:nitrous-oxide reductase
MSVGWQILTPPFDWDLGSTGKGPSSGWAFWTSYNTEMAHDLLEVNSSQKDRDFAAVVNWRAAEQAVAQEKAEMMDGVPMIDPARVPGVLYFVPNRQITPRHGRRSEREVGRRRGQTATRHHGP